MLVRSNPLASFDISHICNAGTGSHNELRAIFCFILAKKYDETGPNILAMDNVGPSSNVNKRQNRLRASPTCCEHWQNQLGKGHLLNVIPIDCIRKYTISVSAKLLLHK